MAPSAQGPFQGAGATASKEDSSFPVRDLSPSTNYAFKVRTFTNPHPTHPNKGVSVSAAVVSAQTSPPGARTATVHHADLRVGEVRVVAVQKARQHGQSGHDRIIARMGKIRGFLRIIEGFVALAVCNLAVI